MKEWEDPMIRNLQQNLEKETSRYNCTYGLCNTLISVPIWLFDPFYAGFLMIIWYMVADSLLAFKGALLTSIGIYIMSFLNIIYKDGRPFWNSYEI